MRSTRLWRKRPANLPTANVDCNASQLPGTCLAFILLSRRQKLLSSRRKHRNFTNAMASRDSANVEITTEVLLKAYACGIFPMAENADDPALYWIEPELRGIIPLETFHVSSRLAPAIPAGPLARRLTPPF